MTDGEADHGDQAHNATHWQKVGTVLIKQLKRCRVDRTAKIIGYCAGDAKICEFHFRVVKTTIFSLAALVRKNTIK